MKRDELFYRAVQRRDPKFDGRFFTAVLTTKIFCRPTCPARTPLQRNVRFYLGAQEAADAGFRACKRCRPDSAADSPAWAGTAATVQRALRLFERGSVSVEEVSERLGVGPRQLRRLFFEALGTTPREVALTCRLHRALTLLQRKRLSMTEVAERSGFNSLRAFHAAFRAELGTAPSRLDAEVSAPPFTLQLRVTQPFDFPAALSYFAPRALPGVEEVGEDFYSRSFSVAQGAGTFRVLAPRGEILPVQVWGPASALWEIARRVRRMFDLDAEPGVVVEALGRSALLAPLAQRAPGLRVNTGFDLFESAVRIVLAQQVTTQGARTLAGRWVEKLGATLTSPRGRLTHHFPTAQALSVLPSEELGMPRSRVQAVRAIAGLSLEGAFSGALTPAELRARLEAMPGIGPWTVECISLRALGEPDAFPETDLALRRAAGLDAEKLLAEVELCRPFRSYAAAHLWHLPI